MITSKQIALIHVAKNRTGMTEPEYRDMLSGFGVESSRQLTAGTFERVMEHFKRIGFTVQGAGNRGWKAAPTGQPLSSRDRMRAKVRAILRDMHLTDSYADAIAKNSCGVDSWLWLKDEDLYKLIGKLTYHQRRHPERRHG